MGVRVLVLLFAFFLISTELSIVCSGDLLGHENINKVLAVGIVDGPLSNASQRAFRFIQEFVNAKILQNNWSITLKFLPDNNEGYLLSEVTGYGLFKIAEGLDAHNITAFIGPGSSTQTKIIHPYAARRKIPHLAPFATDPALGQTLRFPLLIRLSPPDTFQTAAVLDLVQFYGWNRVSLITTENDYGFGVESGLLKLAAARGCKVEYIARYKVLKNAEDIPIFETLDRLQELGPHPVVVVAGLAYGKVIAKAAYLRDMTIKNYWLWMLMDGVAVDEVLNVTYTDKDGKITSRLFDGLIGTRPVMSGGSFISLLKDFWAELHESEKFPWKDGFSFSLEKNFDAILSVAHGFQDYAHKVTLSSANETNGILLRDAILRVDSIGMTSRIAFDPDGKTRSTEYDILLSQKGKWKAIGGWSDLKKLNMSYALAMNYSKGLNNNGKAAIGQSARRNMRRGRIVMASAVPREERPIIHIVTIIEAPFVILGPGNRSGDQEVLTNRVYPKDLHPGEVKPGMDVQLHGYCVDMLQTLSESAGILYTLRLVEDSMFGGYDKVTGEWNGMIDDVIKGRSHAAVAPITVTGQRAEYVDFTTSIMDVGLKFIVDRKAAEGDSNGAESEAFAFLLPFHQSLYVAIAVCVVCLAVYLNVMSRLSPYGTRGHFFLGPRVDQFRRKASTSSLTHASTLNFQATTENKDVKKLLSEKEDAERAMGLNNALYFVWASLFWQTPERVPRAPSSRFVTAVWYLAAVVFVASYTANMVAFVSSQTRDVSNFDSISELAAQTKIQYGTVSGSSVEFILQSSGIKIAAQIYDFMMSDPDNFMVPTSAVGMERLKNGTYALLWDSLVLDLEASKSDCRLKTVDVGFGGVVYAVALPKDSLLTSIFSRHILRLKESGYMATLWNRYFSELDKCIGFDEDDGQNDLHVRRLEFWNLAGVFYLVFFAMGVGVVLLSCEWISAGFFDVNRNDPRAPQTLREALRIRFQRLKQDFLENWLPHPVMDITTRWSSVELPSSSLAMSILAHQLRSELTSSDPSNFYDDEDTRDAEEETGQQRFSLTGSDPESPSPEDRDEGISEPNKRFSLTESVARFSAMKSGQVSPSQEFE